MGELWLWLDSQPFAKSVRLLIREKKKKKKNPVQTFMSPVFEKKTPENVYPQIAHFDCYVQWRTLNMLHGKLFSANER